VVTSNESWRRYLDATTAVGQVTLDRAQEIARGLLSDDEQTRTRARRDLEDLGRASRLFGGQLVALARDELGRQLKQVGSLDELFDRIADVLGGPVRDPARDPSTEVGPAEMAPVADHPGASSAAARCHRTAEPGSKKDSGKKKGAKGAKGDKEPKFSGQKKKNKKDKKDKKAAAKGVVAEGADTIVTLPRSSDAGRS